MICSSTGRKNHSASPAQFREGANSTKVGLGSLGTPVQGVSKGLKRGDGKGHLFFPTVLRKGSGESILFCCAGMLLVPANPP